MKRTQFLKYLAANHCPIKREGSDHTIVMNLETGKKTSVPRHEEIKNSLCNEICKQLDIPKIK